MKLKAEYSVILTMAGPVKFYGVRCPYNIIGIMGRKAMVGSTECQMCSYFGGKHQEVVDNIIKEEITCKHDKI